MQTLKYHRSVLGEDEKREKKKRNQVKKIKYLTKANEGTKRKVYRCKSLF